MTENLVDQSENLTFAILCFLDDAFKRYVILRSVLSNEFALATNLSESVLRREWSDLLNTLGTNLNNEKLINLLCNLLTPYLASAYVLCSTLLQASTIVFQIYCSRLLKAVFLFSGMITTT